MTKCKYILVSLATVALLFTRKVFGSDCYCTCRSVFSNRGRGVCDVLENLQLDVDANGVEIMKWNEHYAFVKRFSENWKDEILRIVQENGSGNADEQNNVRRKLLRQSRKATDGQQKGSRERGLEENGKNIFSFLEERLREVENRTQDLEKNLEQEQETRRQLEENVKRTDAVLNALTNHILNFTAQADEIINLLPGYSKMSFFAKALNEKLDIFTHQLQNDSESLHKVKYINYSRKYRFQMNEAQMTPDNALTTAAQPEWKTAGSHSKKWKTKNKSGRRWKKKKNEEI